MTRATFNLAHIRNSFSQLNRGNRRAGNYKGDTGSGAIMESALAADFSSAVPGPHRFQVFIIPGAENGPEGHAPF